MSVSILARLAQRVERQDTVIPHLPLFFYLQHLGELRCGGDTTYFGEREEIIKDPLDDD